MSNKIKEMVVLVKKNGITNKMKFVPTQKDMTSELISQLDRLSITEIVLPITAVMQDGEVKAITDVNTKLIGGLIMCGINVVEQAEVKMSEKEWIARTMKEAAQFVAENNNGVTKSMVEKSGDNPTPEQLANIVDYTGFHVGKSQMGKEIADKLKAIVTTTKNKGGELWNWLVDTLKWVWAKLKEVVVGVALFTWDVAFILGRHAIAAGKEIAESFDYRLLKGGC